ncbi:MAG: 16S rRNA (guanine(527)-N(7))-methyltransferase RsmG [Candidatus Magnetomorum sp.]|nr:16S rRNA (guanine(527)-N(7))-methyltransferase RsmG [Candidatus Magnetomorum sp.]
MVNLLKNEALQMGICLSEKQIHQFQLYANTLCQWNQKINLTRITTDRDIMIKHFLDSMAVFQVLSHYLKGSFLDVGTGAGFPGIPLALILPNATFTLLDASRKRVNFLKYVINILGLKHVQAYHARVEDWHQADPCKQFDIVISRAFSEMNNFVSLAQSLTRNQGRIIAMKGKNVHEELNNFQPSDNLRMSLEHYTLPIIHQKRYLICFDVDRNVDYSE